MKIFSVFALFYLLYITNPSHALAQNIWLTNTNCVGSRTGFDSDVPTIAGLECVIYNIFRVAISLIGIVIVFMILYGGFQLLTSGGDPKAVEGGKNTITYAVLGLVLAISSWIILTLISRITGNEQILDFEVIQQEVDPGATIICDGPGPGPCQFCPPNETCTCSSTRCAVH